MLNYPISYTNKYEQSEVVSCIFEVPFPGNSVEKCKKLLIHIKLKYFTMFSAEKC